MLLEGILNMLVGNYVCLQETEKSCLDFTANNSENGKHCMTNFKAVDEIRIKDRLTGCRSQICCFGSAVFPA